MTITPVPPSDPCYARGSRWQCLADGTVFKSRTREGLRNLVERTLKNRAYAIANPGRSVKWRDFQLPRKAEDGD